MIGNTIATIDAGNDGGVGIVGSVKKISRGEMPSDSERTVAPWD